MEVWKQLDEPPSNRSIAKLLGCVSKTIHGEVKAPNQTPSPKW
ncbi:hypothetical protein [Enterococcus faecalis]|nr:hypothetical protein [Enterococcus faecalis]